MKFWLFLLGYFFFYECSLAREATLVNKEGKEISVFLIKSDAEKVWFSMKKNGPTKSYELKNLDEKSQDFISNWQKNGGATSSDFEVLVFTGKSNRLEGAQDFDDRKYKFRPKIRIENNDKKLSSPKGTAHLIFFGKPVVYRGTNCVVHRQELRLPVIQPLDEREVVGSPFEFKYDEKDNGEIFGAKYRGYVLIFKNKSGDVIFTKSVPPALLEAGVDKILEMNVGIPYDRKWNRVDGKRVRLQ